MKFLFFCLLISLPAFSAPLDPRLQCLVEAYPNVIESYDDCYMYFLDGSKMPLYNQEGKNCCSSFHTLINKISQADCDSEAGNCSLEEIYLNQGIIPRPVLEMIEHGAAFDRYLNNVSMQDMMGICYQKGAKFTVSKNNDPGRIRYEELFLKIYGIPGKETQKNIKTVKWPNGSVQVTTTNDVATHLLNVGKKLQAKVDTFKKNGDLKNAKLYESIIKSCGGYFVRPIAGTKRWSSHSYGIAMDINIPEYWQWSKPNSEGKYTWKNTTPMDIVEIFESEGFVWGGKWYHFDPMHFEYRPELLNPKCTCKESDLKDEAKGSYVPESDFVNWR